MNVVVTLSQQSSVVALDCIGHESSTLVFIGAVCSFSRLCANIFSGCAVLHTYSEEGWPQRWADTCLNCQSAKLDWGVKIYSQAWHLLGQQIVVLTQMDMVFAVFCTKPSDATTKPTEPLFKFTTVRFLHSWYMTSLHANETFAEHLIRWFENGGEVSNLSKKRETL